MFEPGALPNFNEAEMKKIILLAVVLSVVYPFSSFAETRHDMAGIQFKTLNGWTPSARGFTVAIEHKDKNSIAMVTHIPYPAHGPGLSGVKGIVEEAGNYMLKNSVEEKLILQKIDRGFLKGYYFTLTDKEENTDKEEKPGEYKYIKQGAVTNNQFYLTFTILYNDPHDPSEEALGIISSMKPSKRKPVNIFPLIIREDEIPAGFKGGRHFVEGKPRCFSKQPTFYYSVISNDKKLNIALKPDFKYYQSFYDTKGHLASLLFMQFANPQRGIPFVKRLIWGDKMKPTKRHPERIFAKNNVLMVLCIKPGDEEVYNWIIKKYG